MRRTDLSRKTGGWTNTGGPLPSINEVVELLHCGRQKAVNTLQELQYTGLVEIQKQNVENPIAFTQNPTKRFQTPTSKIRLWNAGGLKTALHKYDNQSS
ncbi:MAG: hypothetical protein ACLRQV_27395 [Hungatella sp.]|uniref:hypothetical protein n=1 Tax=Hungatella sp. TaxID=2613924 RepID=UPI003990B514